MEIDTGRMSRAEYFQYYSLLLWEIVLVGQGLKTRKAASQPKVNLPPVLHSICLLLLRVPQVVVGIQYITACYC